MLDAVQRPMSLRLWHRLRDMPDPAAVARAILDRKRHLTLAGTTPGGRDERVRVDVAVAR